MKRCIKDFHVCIGRDARDLLKDGMTGQCCKDEMRQERYIVQNIIDAIDDCSKDLQCLQKVSSKLSYGASVINKNGEEELMEVFPIIKRFSLLLYEFQEKILNDNTTQSLIISFTEELKKWFSYSFLEERDLYQLQMQRKSITSDINTIEMALGVCMLDQHYECLDDIFF